MKRKQEESVATPKFNVAHKEKKRKVVKTVPADKYAVSGSGYTKYLNAVRAQKMNERRFAQDD